VPLDSLRPARHAAVGPTAITGIVAVVEEATPDLEATLRRAEQTLEALPHAAS
jgi:hypothetical protein